MALLLAAALSGMVGCGDSLADASYRGEVLFEVGGPVRFDTTLEPQMAYLCLIQQRACRTRCAPDDIECVERCDDALSACVSGDIEVFFSEMTLGVSVFWAVSSAEAELLEQTSVITPGLPARYALTLYQPPPISALNRAPSGPYAIGGVIAFNDANGDRRLDPSREELIGGHVEAVILYAPEGLDEPDLGLWPPGFHRVEVRDCVDPDVPYAIVPAENDEFAITFYDLEHLAELLFPDLGCDGELSEWEECASASTRARCAETPASMYCLACELLGSFEESGLEP